MGFPDIARDGEYLLLNLFLLLLLSLLGGLLLRLLRLRGFSLLLG
jgi:hypothetical protein